MFGNGWGWAHGALRMASRLNIGSCPTARSEEHTSELQSLMRISYAVFCLKKKKLKTKYTKNTNNKKSPKINKTTHITKKRKHKKQVNKTNLRYTIINN